jgi:hypothetical protein
MQEPPLAILVQFPYLVQEERSHLIAVLVALSIRSHAEMTFQRFGYYCRTRYLHKAKVSVLRQAVNLHCDDFFACAAFSKQQDRYIGWRNLGDQPLYGLHFRAYARNVCAGHREWRSISAVAVARELSQNHRCPKKIALD